MRSTPRCSTATPLGRPVLPDVKSTYARLRERGRTPVGVTGCASRCSSSTKRHGTVSDTGRRGRSARVVSSSRGGASSTMYVSRCVGYAASSGT
ncbi:hypothetical protein COSO111634_27470 [Corallococcus soli]